MVLRYQGWRKFDFKIREREYEKTRIKNTRRENETRIFGQKTREKRDTRTREFKNTRILENFFY